MGGGGGGVVEWRRVYWWMHEGTESKAPRAGNIMCSRDEVRHNGCCRETDSNVNEKIKSSRIILGHSSNQYSRVRSQIL